MNGVVSVGENPTKLTEGKSNTLVWCDNVLKCIFVIYLCERYLLITMLNLYN